MKFIVTTTINEPTRATEKFCELATSDDNWRFVIVGDKTTPHQSYQALEQRFPNIIYLDPEEQQRIFPLISDHIGWQCIQRRNIGLIYAYACGAELIATVDDDNIPYESWGQDIKVGQQVTYDSYMCTASEYFDPLSITRHNHIWHRGYPIEYLQVRHQTKHLGKKTRRCLVQANLWDGEPDVDALARLVYRPTVNYDDVTSPFGSDQVAPFNSQNTILHRSVIPWYAVLPGVGRMDDIWGSYILQHHFPDSVIYDAATVYQDRNQQDPVKNLEDEIFGYRNTLKFLESGQNYESLLPPKTLAFWNSYRSHFKSKDSMILAQEHFRSCQVSP